jgi:RimJ/RimL family protein N-acetyltransferase
MRIRLLPQTAAHLKALRSGADAYRRVSDYRLADGLFELATGPEETATDHEDAAVADVWRHGLAIAEFTEDVIIGFCGYKGPPTEEGVVEIAYGLAPAYRGRGYATEAAKEIVERAFAVGAVRKVLAHTLRLCEKP